ncbi:xylulokinase [Nonomuraea sp. SBT364]|uniref:xylulokinase n=1 Tax=Nonomuraea sp. SBT364 TaxID=1580530 RepID=UPI00066B1DD3|nr:xylulokinase [Nonomuraea sp. SBT364]
MSAQRVVIGIDSSTQSAKAVAVDVDTGALVGEGRAAHAVTTGGGRESDPGQWWQALCAAVEATGHAAGAAAVSVGGQQHGLVTLDAAGAPVRPALLWNDVRSAGQAAALAEKYGADRLAERVGSVPTAAFTLTKWLWLTENEPANAARVAAVRLPHDYLTERLTGEGVTDRGDASGTGWWTPSGYDTELLDAAGLDPSLLPRVVSGLAGTVRAGGPLAEGTPVASGTGDNMAAALGLGLLPGTPVLSLGTSGTVYAVTRRRPADPSGIVAGFADALGNWLPLACTLNCTQAVDKIAELLGRDRDAVEPGGTAVVLPYLDGERTPNLPHAAGLLYGLRHDTTAGQVLQAAYDGAAHSLLAALDDVLRAGGESPDPDVPLVLIGGGARGAAWRETIRRLSGRPVLVPEAAELVALGAAAQAAALLTGEAPDEVARRWGTARGDLLPPVPRDAGAMERIAGTLPRAGRLLATP